MRWLAVAALVAVAVWWMLRPAVVPADLGPATRLVTRAGVDACLVQDGSSWRLVSGRADVDGSDLELPGDLVGTPCLDGQGRVLARSHAGLLRLAVDVAGTSLAREVLELPDALSDAALVDVDGLDEPVLVTSDAEPRLVVHGAGGWMILEQSSDGGDGPRPPADAPIVVSPHGRALAFLGRPGWELWLYEEPEAPVRRVASGCRGEHAIFTPDGSALVIDGRTSGLWRIELESEAQGHMAAGNLGSCDRVPWSACFRGDPVMLMAPQWDIQGYLQLLQTHLSGGGRWGFTSGLLHHYLPDVSRDGRHLVYAQAAFDPEGEAPFEEELFLFDFDAPQRAAISLGTRAGGERDVGPAFLGEGSTLVWIADRRLHRVVPPAP